MKLVENQFRFSATDLANHLACGHLTELNRLVAENLLQREYRRDPMVELLVELGQKHEAAYLSHLRDSGKSIVEIEVHSTDAAARTLDAMKSGTDVIAQAFLVADHWEGRADLLLKVDRPSHLGDWSYEVAGTKLSQTTKGQAVLLVAERREPSGIAKPESGFTAKHP